MTAAMIAVALVNFRKPDIHKRLMLVATISLLQVAIGRWFVLFLKPPDTPVGAVPPVIVTVGPAILTDVLIVAAMVHDRRTRGRVHSAYWISGAVLLAVQLLRVPLSTSAGWYRTLDVLVALTR